MNNGKLSLQNPDNLKNKIVRSRTDSIDIPRWDNFQETNNEVPTMDYSPIYDESSPEVRKNSPNKQQQIQMQEPIRIGNQNNLHENKGLLAQIYDWCVGVQK
jgi:hypothetical protein